MYDHFGDFEAFILETFEGGLLRFHSHEAPVLRLVHEAWRQRILITVLVRPDRPERPIEIIFRDAPPPYEG